MACSKLAGTRELSWSNVEASLEKRRGVEPTRLQAHYAGRREGRQWSGNALARKCGSSGKRLPEWEIGANIL